MTSGDSGARLSDAQLRKSRKTTATLLERAKRALPSPSKVQEEQYVALLAQYKEFLDHSELELALDELAELSNLVPCRGGFWRDLARAAESMGLRAKMSEFEGRFHEVLDRTSPASDWSPK